MPKKTLQLIDWHIGSPYGMLAVEHGSYGFSDWLMPRLREVQVRFAGSHRARALILGRLTRECDYGQRRGKNRVVFTHRRRRVLPAAVRVLKREQCGR